MKFSKLVKLSHKMLELPTTTNKHFSFLLIRNKILASGYSIGWKTNPLAKKYGYRFNNIHSEMSVIKNFPYPPAMLSKCTLVNIRIMKSGQLGMARPCHHCSKLLQDFDLTNVWYTNWQGKFEKSPQDYFENKDIS